MTSTIFKSNPLTHQLREWEESWNLNARAVFWEPGVGKTALVLYTMCSLWEAGEIDALIVVAPNGVHENWTLTEIPKHVPDDLPVRCHTYEAKRSTTKWHKRACDSLIDWKGLSILTITYDAVITKAGKAYLKKVLQKRKVLYVLDESHRAKTPSALRTRVLIASSRYAPYKRILTGTPVTNSPFDLWSQIRFLDPEYWAENGFASLEAFKTYFGVWEDRINGQTGQRFKQLLYHKNVDQLARIIAPISTRLTKEQVLDLPPRTYEKRYVELSPRQKELYKQMKEEFFALVDEEAGPDGMVTAMLVITQMIRLQQIVCGYLPSDDGEVLHRLEEKNPRIEFLSDLLEDFPGQVIIWARFREDITQIVEKLGESARRLDGKTPKGERASLVKKFQSGDFRYLVSNPAVGGRGYDLTAGKTMVYYSNSEDLEHRLQSEDRPYRHGQKDPVHVIDIVAKGTGDVKRVNSLVKKQRMAARINKDELKEWI